MSDKELFILIHDMMVNGEAKKKVIEMIMEVRTVKKSQAYRLFDKYINCGDLFKKKSDVKESIKKTLYNMYMAAAGKNHARAAVEVLDRLLIVCPWIKDEEDIKKDTEINLIIKEWKSGEDKGNVIDEGDKPEK